MRYSLIALFSFVFLVMLSVTIYASLDRSVLKVGQEILSDRWFQATLVDAYLSFLVFYAWVFYKETGGFRKGLWLVLILGLGTMAMATYVLVQLWKADPKQPLATMLLRGDSPLINSTNG